MLGDRTFLIEELCQQGFSLIDPFLPPKTCRQLHEYAANLYKQGQFRQAKIGVKTTTQENAIVRGDEIFWLDQQQEIAPALLIFLQKIQQLMQELNQHLFLGLVDFETHFAIYQTGTYYKKHVDQFATQKTRKISFVYYLNQGWQEQWGGQLKIYDLQDQLKTSIFPQENRLVCFNSELPHEVITTKRPRFSLTGWMKIRDHVHLF